MQTSSNERLKPGAPIDLVRWVMWRPKALSAKDIARAMRPRLGLDCRIKLLEQTDFSEPLARINTHPIDGAALGWSESAAWDGVADYYRYGTVG